MLEYLLTDTQAAMSAANSAQSAASAAKYSADQAGHDVQRLSGRVAALELALETILRLGLEKGMFTEAEFCRMANKVDMEDGVLDGRRDLNKMRKVCGKCRKANPADRRKCMWCEDSLQQVKPQAAT